MSDKLKVVMAVCDVCDHIKPGVFDGAPCFNDPSCGGTYKQRTFRVQSDE